jgi:hypothetical protein
MAQKGGNIDMKKNLKFTTSLILFCLFLLFLGCSYTQRPDVKVGNSDVGGTGDIQYSYEVISPNKRILTVTAAPGLMETESSIEQRILIYANKFAAKDCDGEYDSNFDQSIAKGFMKRTKTYVYKCSK